MSLEALAFGVVSSLIATAISKLTGFDSLNYIEKVKIKSTLDKAVALSIEPLIPWLISENVSSEKQNVLFQCCQAELEYFASNPHLIFDNSLNGQQLYDNIYGNKDLPQEILEEDLSDVFLMLFPRITTIFCSILPLTKEWELRSWEANYRKLDQMARDINNIVTTLDKMSDKGTDASFTLCKKSMLQRLKLNIDLTSLRADKSVTGKLLDFFIQPSFQHKIGSNSSLELEDNDSIISNFMHSDNNKILIVGDPGSGKSTWLQWLQHTLLSSNESTLPFLVSLRSINISSLPSLNEIVRNNIGKHISEDIKEDTLINWKSNGNYTVLLDGFDEIKPSLRDTIYEWISDVILSAPNCRFIITSRPLTTNHVIDFCNDFILWIIMPFDENRIINYINKWYTNTNLLSNTEIEIDAHELAREWKQDLTIEPLTSNPLLLSTLLMVHHLDGKLPKGRSSLYERYVNGMLGLWDDRRNIILDIPDFDIDFKNTILSNMALYMFNNSKDQLDEEDAIILVKKILKYYKHDHDPHIVLKTLRERTGLIIGPGIYSFVHKSVSEYFVAKLIVQGNTRNDNGSIMDRLLLFSHRESDTWQVVLFIWAGLASAADIEEFISECVKIEDYETACGLLYDQYNRLDPDYRIDTLMRVLKKIRLADNFYYAWSFPHEPNKSEQGRLSIKTFSIRGLFSRHIHHLIEVAVNSTDILWKTKDYTTDDLIISIWIHSSYYEKDYERWLVHVDKPPFDERKHVRAYFASISLIITKALNNNAGKLSKVQYKKIEYLAYKTKRSMPLIILVGKAIRIYNHQIDWKRYNNMFEALKKIELGKKDLLGSERLVVRPVGKLKGVDILNKFLVVADSEEAKDAINYVRKLVDIRDS